MAVVSWQRWHEEPAGEHRGAEDRARGAIGDRIGLEVLLVALFGIKAVAVLLPTVSVAPATLALSSVLVGALSPGLTSVLSARISKLVDPSRQAQTWAIATLAFSLAQAASGYGLSFIFVQSGS
jgi:predicted MFS family arabinose efflux permease